MNRQILTAMTASALLLGSACDDRDLGPLPGIGDENHARFAVRSADFSSGTSVSFLDADGAVLVDDFINSGSTAPGLTLTIGSDTDFPSVQEDGILTIIDRYGSDIVTRVRISDGTVLGQFRAQGTSSTGFSANPQDILYVDSQTAWLSRYSVNTAPNVNNNVRGSDLIAFNPSTMKLTSARIDLSSLELDVDAYGTPDIARVRPKRIVRVGAFAAIGLDMLTETYSFAGPGRMAVIGIETHALTHFDVGGGLTNCGNLSAVPGSTSLVAIMCQGYNDRSTESGLVIVAIDPTTGVVTELHRYTTADHAAEPYAFDAVVVIDENEFVGTNLGGYDETKPPDTLIHVNMATGARTTLFTSAKGSQLFTQGAYDFVTGLLLVPDTSAGLRRFYLGTDGTFTSGELVVVNGHGLPARTVGLLP